jgi:hypothetical protein
MLLEPELVDTTTTLTHQCTGAVLALEQNPVWEDLVLAADMAGNAVVLSLATEQPIFTAGKHAKYVVRAKWSACGQYFATASYDRTVALYGPPTAVINGGPGTGGAGGSSAEGGGRTTAAATAATSVGKQSLDPRAEETYSPSVPAAAAAGDEGGEENASKGPVPTEWVLLKTLNCTGPVESLAFTPSSVRHSCVLGVCASSHLAAACSFLAGLEACTRTTLYLAAASSLESLARTHAWYHPLSSSSLRPAFVTIVVLSITSHLTGLAGKRCRC